MAFFWRKRRKQLTSLEKKVLDAITAALPESARSRWIDQIRGINLIQRSMKGKNVNLYRMARGKPTFDENIRFPWSMPGSLIAIVHLKTEAGFLVRVDIWITGGFLFSINFYRSPKTFTITNVEDVYVLINPMNLCFTPVHINQLPSELRDLFPGYVLEDGYPAASSEDVSLARKILPPSVPPDYEMLINMANGFTINNWHIFGTNELRSAAMPDAVYWLLAEKESVGSLAIADTKPGIFVINYSEPDTPKLIGFSYVEALKRIVRESVE